MKIALLALTAAVLGSTAARCCTQTTTLNLVNDGLRDVRVSSASDRDPPPGMVFVPAGDVVMGSDLDTAKYLGDGDEGKIALAMAEVPRHTTRVEALFIDRTEVTNLQWKVYLDATGREPSDLLVQYGWPGGKIPDGLELHPISLVSFPEAVAFLSWAGKRLPTEAEWTMAARGPGNTRDYPWGERWDSANCQSASTTPAGPARVGSYPKGASPCGALDMCGNVFEWVDEPFSSFSGFEPFKLKRGRKTETVAPEFNRSHRVAKGGSFANARNDMRIDLRLGNDTSNLDEALGFRGARSFHDGVDVIAHAYKRLLPPSVAGMEDLDLNDVVAQEVTNYDNDGQIITDHRYLSFAHPVAKRGDGLARMRTSAREEPVTLGVLSTSEALVSPPLPPGDYLLAYKGEGESKAHREKRKTDKKLGGADESPPPPPPSDDGPTLHGASAPWPGVGASHIVADIDYPQDKEVILFHNVNNAVVGFLLMPDIQEIDQSAATLSDGGDGKTWTIEFSLDTMPRNRKMPRFKIPLALHGAGLK